VLERRLGGGKLGGEQAQDVQTTRLRGKLARYVPRGAQYDYKPPSVFARYKVLTAVFAVILVLLFGYWTIVLRQTRTAGRPSRPAQQVAPSQSDPVYVEPLAPK
jgi:hypothetical protein